MPLLNVLPPDGAWRLEWRRLMTGVTWITFGLGGLALSLTWFPWLNLTERHRERRIQRARWAIYKSFRAFRWWCEFLGVATYDTQAIAPLRERRGVLIVANHPTLLDYVLIASELPALDCLVKAELSKNVFLKGVVKAADYLLNSQSEEILFDCQRRLSQGDNILIFPEGTRTRPGEPLKLKRGPAHIALRLGVPLCVVHIHCTGRWLEKGSPWWRIPPAKPQIVLWCGETLEAKDYLDPTEEGYSRASRRLTAALKDHLTPSPSWIANNE